MARIRPTEHGRIIIPPCSQNRGGIHANVQVYEGVFQGENGNHPMSPGSPSGFTPSKILAAYGISANAGSNAIAVVDAFDLPTALADFNTFSTQFGLPTEPSTTATAATNKVFQVVYAEGSQPINSNLTGWDAEIALDMEWAHAMAPKAKIYLVESSSEATLFHAAQVAQNLPSVKEVSMSWGQTEDTIINEFDYDFVFQTATTVFFASAGDTGGEHLYPALSPWVVDVGGTTLHMSGNSVTSETTWADSGGGPSSQELIPSYQLALQPMLGNRRGGPDVSAVADPATGVSVYDGEAGGWIVLGGTSVSSPVMAGITNARGEFAGGTYAELSRLYDIYNSANYSTLYRDITSGSDGVYSAGVGWDFATGVGVPKGMYPTVASTTYLPTNLAGQYGSLASGTVASLNAADGNNLVWNFLTVTATTQNADLAMFSVDFVLDQPAKNYASLKFNLNATLPFFFGGSFGVYAYNTSTRTFDFFSSAGMGAPTDFAASSFLSTHEFTNGAGQHVLRLAIKMIGVPGFVGQQLQTDRFTLTGTRKNIYGP